MAEGQLHTCDNLSGQALSSISEQERVKAPQHSGIMTGCIFARASRREGARAYCARGHAQQDKSNQATCVSCRFGSWLRRAACLSRTFCKCACTNSGAPNGVPSNTSPRSSAASAGSPNQMREEAERDNKPSGSTPALFHMAVLDRFSTTRVRTWRAARPWRAPTTGDPTPRGQQLTVPAARAGSAVSRGCGRGRAPLAARAGQFGLAPLSAPPRHVDGSPIPI